MNSLEIDGVRLELRRLPAAARWPRWFSCMRGWGRSACGLSAGGTGRWRCIRSRPRRCSLFKPAQPGGRQADALPPDYMQREAWDGLPALLQRLGIENPVLLGHSDGASIALLHTSRQLVAACIAMAPHVLVEDIAIQSITGAREAFESGRLRERLARHHADVDGAFRQWNDVWLSEAFGQFDIR